MKKLVFILSIGVVCSFSCSQKNYVSVSSTTITEKEEILINNNKQYVEASIVGGGARLIEQEKELKRKKKNQQAKDILSQIEGVKVSSFQDAEGKEQVKATMQGDILFAFDKYELSPDAIIVMEKLSSALSKIESQKINIVGHTDNIGENSYNTTLSLNRANSVRDFLKEKGYPAELIQIEGRGYNQPIATNTTPEGRAKNRRVDIYLIND